LAVELNNACSKLYGSGHDPPSKAVLGGSIGMADESPTRGKPRNE